MEQEAYKYFAFISYNSKDTEWGKRVQRKLEHYRMQATLCSGHGWERRPIKLVFFAPTDIQLGGQTETSVHNPHLPPQKDAIVTMTLDNETKTDTVPSLDSHAVLANIPTAISIKRHVCG